MSLGRWDKIPQSDVSDSRVALAATVAALRSVSESPNYSQTKRRVRSSRRWRRSRRPVWSRVDGPTPSWRACTLSGKWSTLENTSRAAI